MRKRNLGRLQEILNQIEDEELKEVISGTFRVEISFRSAERSNFPRKKIIDVIEGVARSVESKTKQLGIDEISTN